MRRRSTTSGGYSAAGRSSGRPSVGNNGCTLIVPKTVPSFKRNAPPLAFGGTLADSFICHWPAETQTTRRSSKRETCVVHAPAASKTPPAWCVLFPLFPTLNFALPVCPATLRTRASIFVTISSRCRRAAATVACTTPSRSGRSARSSRSSTCARCSFYRRRASGRNSATGRACSSSESNSLSYSSCHSTSGLNYPLHSASPMSPAHTAPAAVLLCPPPTEHPRVCEPSAPPFCVLGVGTALNKRERGTTEKGGRCISRVVPPRA